MAHKEYGVTDILDLLRRVKAKDSQRRIARATGMDRKTVRNYLGLAAEHGFANSVADDQLSEIAAAFFCQVHGGQSRPSEPGACAPLLPHRELLSGWLETDGLSLTKAHIKLGRMGVDVTYSTLYRYARETLGFGGPKVTVRMAQTEPGEVAQCDFGRMGLVFDPETGRDRVLHALVVTLVFSRHQYVFLTHRQDLDALIAGIEEAWEFFGGVCRRLIPDYVLGNIIDDHQFRHAAEERKGAGVGAEPVGQALTQRRLGKGVAAGSQHRDEDLGLADLAGVRIDNRQGVTGVIDEQLLPGLVHLAHGDLQFTCPAAVQFTEMAVAIPLRMLGNIFLPE